MCRCALQVGHAPTRRSFMTTRRDFIKLALGTSALWSLHSACKSSKKKEPLVETPPLFTGPPRYYVLLLLSGGHDSVYTTDPKSRADVLADVDLPTDNTIKEAGGIALGPHFAPLSPWADRMAILNGIQVGTANHDTGHKQFFRLKSNIASRMPTALDIIGQTRDEEQPLGAVYLNLTMRVLHSPGYFGYADRFYFGNDTIFDAINQADASELERLASTMKRKSDSLRRHGASSREARATIQHLDEVSDFFGRVADLPPFYPTDVTDDYTSQSMSESLQRTAWLIENDLTRCVHVDLGLLGWDTHQRNADRQAEMNGNFVQHFGAFLEALQSRSNKHGRLLDRTAIVVGSDLGRFPRLNDMLGKDHLPQTSFFFMAPGIAGGKAYGQTGKEMEALPISLATGKPRDDGRHIILDDVGTTLLRMASLDPQRYGYSGKVLDFLMG